jgi:DNA-binding CsgD family transcriptional regulator
MATESFTSLIGDIYEAVFEPALWPSILERIADSVHATTTAFALHDPETRYGLVLGHVRADPSLSQMYDDYYHKLNPHIQKLSLILSTGELAVGQSVISDEALEQTEYYNDFLKRQDLFHLAGGTIAREGSLRYGLTTLRPRRKGEFEARELKPLQALFPHLARAARISKELNTSAHVLQSFVTLQIGLILLDRQGRVIQANAPAEGILNQKDGLSLNAQGQLLSQKRNDSLPAKLMAAIATATGEGSHAGGDVLIERHSGKTPYRLSIMPLRVSNFVSQWKQAVAAIFVTDPHVEPCLDSTSLQKHYGVTRHEAAVAALLVQGLDLNEICAQLGVKKTTVRTQIRGLMDKFAVKRQVALVLKLSKIGAGRSSFNR